MRAVSNDMRVKLRDASPVFAERGFDGTTIEALSEATGVPSSTLYYYFDGKKEILAFLLGDWLSRTSMAVEAAIAGGGSAKGRLMAAVTTQLEAMANNPATCQVLVSELGRIDRLPDIANAVNSAFPAPVARLLSEGVASKEFRVVDIETTTSVLYGAVIITGLHHVIISDGGLPAFDSTVVAKTVMDLLLNGLTK